MQYTPEIPLFAELLQLVHILIALSQIWYGLSW